MAQRMRITYAEGTVDEVTTTPLAQVKTERYLRGQGGINDTTGLEASYRLAYEACNPGNIGFDEWLTKVSEVEPLCMKCGEPLGDDPDEHKCAEKQAAVPSDPTLEAPSPTPSFD